VLERLFLWVDFGNEGERCVSRSLIRVAVFEWNPKNLLSWLIALATGCRFSHAAIEIEGVWYDASESRGSFDRADLGRLRGRLCRVAAFEGDLSEWLTAMRGRQYDYAGVAGWLVCRFVRRGCGHSQRVYCFEAVNAALAAAGRVSCATAAVSGCDLLGVLPGGVRFGRFEVDAI